MLVDSVERDLAELFSPFFLFDSNENGGADVSFRPLLGEPLGLYQVTPRDCDDGQATLAIRYQILFNDDGGWHQCSGGTVDEHVGDNDTTTATVVYDDGLFRLQRFGKSVSHHHNQMLVAGPFDLCDSSNDWCWYWNDEDEKVQWDGCHAGMYLSSGKHHVYFFGPVNECVDSWYSGYSIREDRWNGGYPGNSYLLIRTYYANWDGGAMVNGGYANVGEAHVCGEEDPGSTLGTMLCNGWLYDFYGVDSSWPHDGKWEDEFPWKSSSFLDNPGETSSLGSKWTESSPRSAEPWEHCSNDPPDLRCREGKCILLLQICEDEWQDDEFNFDCDNHVDRVRPDESGGCSSWLMLHRACG
jgi:hypothetical protein